LADEFKNNFSDNFGVESSIGSSNTAIVKAKTAELASQLFDWSCNKLYNVNIKSQ